MLKIHAETFDPLYSHMLIKKKEWELPATEAFAELVLHRFVRRCAEDHCEKECV